MSKFLNNRGFAVVETILILIIVLLIGGIGTYVYKTNQSADTTARRANEAVGKSFKASTSTDIETKKPVESQTDILTSSQKQFTIQNLQDWPSFPCKDTDGILLLPKAADNMSTNCYTSDLKAPFRDLDYTFQAVIAKGQNPYNNPDLNGDYKKISFSLNKDIPGEKLTYSQTSKANGETTMYNEYLFKINGQEYTAYFFQSPFWTEMNKINDRADLSVADFEKFLQTIRESSAPVGPRG